MAGVLPQSVPVQMEEARAGWSAQGLGVLTLVSLLLCLFEIFYNKNFENNNRKINKSPFLTLGKLLIDPFLHPTIVNS